ncbi:AraC family transcriptional activator of mtrCDE [Volucribacter psittacicida]|uniref:AraC family transcriptional activator of mtrCDE n=1 Tax=Volucribacter psittacicida TaxID=203482 RepID=A0A4R1FXE9_9PAST|nr:AraC family transcriptional regulator [Volucribacter psittacicida]TCJ98910.1 AraC family transcriptional activator of mtrCDE [Volucribacter psittacicida]
MPIATFIQRLDLQTEIDVFCQLAKGFDFPHAPQANSLFFHLMLQGKCQLHNAQGQSYPLKTGDFCLWLGNEAHRLSSQGKAPSIHEHFHHLRHRQSGQEIAILCGRFLANNPAAATLLNLFPKPLIVSLAKQPNLHALAQLIYQEASQPQAGSQKVISDLSQLLLLFALRQPPTQSLHPYLPLFGDKHLAPALYALLANPRKHYTIDELANLAHCSRQAFNRRFHQLSGMNLQTFYLHLRLSLASQLLKAQQLSVAATAEAIGYQSLSTFNSIFKKYMGCSPAVYKRGNE